MEGKKDNFLSRIRHYRLVMLGIFGSLLGVTAITGIQSINRYIPPFLIVILAIAGGSVLILSIAISIMKNLSRYR